MRVPLKTLWTALIACAIALQGCYEETGVSQPQQPQAQQPAPVEQGPITSMGQSSGSALGGAKRTAGNVVDRAEQKSREVGEAADEIANPER